MKTAIPGTMTEQTIKGKNCNMQITSYDDVHKEIFPEDYNLQCILLNAAVERKDARSMYYARSSYICPKIFFCTGMIFQNIGIVRINSAYRIIGANLNLSHINQCIETT